MNNITQPYLPDPGKWFQTPQWPSCFPWKCKAIVDGNVITVCGRLFDPEQVYMRPFNIDKLAIIYGGSPRNRVLRCIETE